MKSCHRFAQAPVFGEIAMRIMPLLLAVGLLAVAGFALNSVAGVSNTLIGAGKTFMLGGQQWRSMTIKGKNIGNTEVEVLLLEERKERSITPVKPDKSFSIDLPARNTALFRNHASSTASVRLELTHAVSGLSMGYENGDDGL
jgi:hypothetical protein